MNAQRQKDTKTVVIMYKNYFTYYSFGIIQKKKKKIRLRIQLKLHGFSFI